MKLEELEAKILDKYFTSQEELEPFLNQIDKKLIIKYLINLIHRYANDVNSSTLREIFTLIKAGYSIKGKKLGYNGETCNGQPCEVKPVNIRSGSKNKLNGGGNFSDFTYERLEKYLNDNVVILASGFVDGQIVYIIEFPFAYLKEEIKRQLDKFFGSEDRRRGEYLRSANFSFKHYKDKPVKIIYKAPDLDKFKEYLTKDLYYFLSTKNGS